MTIPRVFPPHDNHIAEYWHQFGVRFAKWRGSPRRDDWRGAGLAAMWSMILAWQAIRLAVRGAR